MSFWHLPAPGPEPARVSRRMSTHLHGRWLILARMVWMAVVLLTVGRIVAWGGKQSDEAILTLQSRYL
jgi:hypothetical protein